MEAERSLLEKALARFDEVIATLPVLPAESDAVLMASSAKKPKKESARDPERGIGTDGLVLPPASVGALGTSGGGGGSSSAGGDAAPKPKKR